MLKRVAIGTGVSLLFAAFSLGAFLWWQSLAAGNPDFFESSILAFEEADRAQRPPAEAIVFIGSSSIRFWKSLPQDMAPFDVIRRGYGGAHMEHIIHNANRVITPYAPRAVVVFVGGNDIASGKPPSRVIADYATFLEIMARDLPKTDIWLLSMKPSKLRWDQWSIMQQVNEGLSEFAESSEHIRFVDTGATLLGPDGEPDDVYAFDGLHLNEEGYRRWTKLLKPKLLAVYSPGD